MPRVSFLMHDFFLVFKTSKASLCPKINNNNTFLSNKLHKYLNVAEMTHIKIQYGNINIFFNQKLPKCTSYFILTYFIVF